MEVVAEDPVNGSAATAALWEESCKNSSLVSWLPLERPLLRREGRGEVTLRLRLVLVGSRGKNWLPEVLRKEGSG